jgi:hypothetical protein
MINKTEFLQSLAKQGFSEQMINNIVNGDPVDVINDVDYQRNILKQAIKEYDSSNNINVFYVNNIPMWLDKNTRTGLLLRFQSEKALN